MKIKILCENSVPHGSRCVGEHGLSVYIEDGTEKILLDMGQTDVFMKNAELMGVDLDNVTTCVFSHGHNDHTKGILKYVEKYGNKKRKLIAHPKAFDPKMNGSGSNVGMPISKEEAENHFSLYLTDGVLPVSENIMFLGKIPRENDFEGKKPLFSVFENGKWDPDLIEDDTAIVYKDADGIFVITGCSHSGICNIVEYAKKVSGEVKIKGILGGFHLIGNDENIQMTIDYLAKQDIKAIYPCHCVDFAAKVEMAKSLPFVYVGAGSELEI